MIPASLNKLSAEDRLSYALDTIIEHQALWGLMGKEGWVLVDTEDGICLPIWPDESLALAWGETKAAGAEPQMISLEDWKNTWLPGMEKNDTSVIVCPFFNDYESTLLSANQLILYIDESEA